MYEFRLPDIGEGLSEAELLEWTVKVGERVAEGDELAQISTDKVNVDLPSPSAGVITELCCEPGDVVAVGTVIVRIEDGRESQASIADTSSVTEQAVAAVGKDPDRVAREAVKAAPIVRRYATEHQVNINELTGSGPGGQIMRQDVDDFLRSAATAQDPSVGQDRLRLSGARLAAARRLAHASSTMATSTLSFEVSADAIVARCKALSAAQNKITPLTVIAVCLARALAACPHFNATVNDENNELVFSPSINLGLAVDTEDGLMVPVLKAFSSQDESRIAERIADLASRARSGTLELAETQDSTFTLSSTGGLEQATLTGTTPIINFPNVATLWVSRILERPRVVDGALGIGPMMACSLSFDHRYLHGADGIALINELDRLFSNPDRN